MSECNEDAQFHAFINALKQQIPQSYIYIQPEQTVTFECDALNIERCLPKAVLSPRTTLEIQTILKLCGQYDVPIVARGAGTGLSGGARPVENGVVLNLSHLNRILNIDSDNLQATVEPGVRNLAISQAAKPYGLYYAPDPSSQIACTIGGNIAENAGGIHCLKYGLTVNNVTALTMIDSKGEILELGSAGLDYPGYDFTALLNGSEGLLGIIVQATVKLLPIPDLKHVIMASFDHIDHAAQAVNRIITSGIIPAGLEMMDRLTLKALSTYMPTDYPDTTQAVILCELDGDTSSVLQDTQRITAIINDTRANSWQVAETTEQCDRLWALRKAAFPAVGQLAPDYFCMDGTIPRHQLANALSRINDLSHHYNLRCANVFHAGDGNLHPLILFDANNEDELSRAKAFGQEILLLCLSLGGTITGEHGVGVEKLDAMCSQFNTAELAQFQRIKKAFDPLQLLNPGKAIPTLHRCAELGLMHVHNGQLPFPDIERF